MLGLVAALVLVPVLMTGCVLPDGPHAPLAMRKDGESVLLAICSRGHIESISVEERDLRADNPEWIAVWKATADLTLTAPAILTVGDSREGIITSVAGSMSTEPGHEYVVQVLRSTNSSAGTPLLGSFSKTQEGSLSEDHWLQTTGEQTVEPCRGQ